MTVIPLAHLNLNWRTREDKNVRWGELLRDWKSFYLALVSQWGRLYLLMLHILFAASYIILCNAILLFGFIRYFFINLLYILGNGSSGCLFSMCSDASRDIVATLSTKVPNIGETAWVNVGKPAIVLNQCGKAKCDFAVTLPNFGLVRFKLHQFQTCHEGSWGWGKWFSLTLAAILNHDSGRNVTLPWFYPSIGVTISPCANLDTSEDILAQISKRIPEEE